MKLHFSKGGFQMARNKGLMSENLKEEIAKELGVYEQVKHGEVYHQKTVVVWLQKQ